MNCTQAAEVLRTATTSPKFLPVGRTWLPTTQLNESFAWFVPTERNLDELGFDLQLIFRA